MGKKEDQILKNICKLKKRSLVSIRVLAKKATMRLPESKKAKKPNIPCKATTEPSLYLKIIRPGSESGPPPHYVNFHVVIRSWDQITTVL